MAFLFWGHRGGVRPLQLLGAVASALVRAPGGTNAWQLAEHRQELR